MRLADWMALRAISDRQLADRLGVSQVAVLRYRRGERIPHWDILQRLSEVSDGAVMPNDFLARGPVPMRVESSVAQRVA